MATIINPHKIVESFALKKLVEELPTSFEEVEKAVKVQGSLLDTLYDSMREDNISVSPTRVYQLISNKEITYFYVEKTLSVYDEYRVYILKDTRETSKKIASLKELNLYQILLSDKKFYCED